MRTQLQQGVSEKQAEKLQTFVLSIVRQVEQICARGGITADQLPAPSRNAYRFLKGLNLSAVPLIADGSSAPVPRPRLKNVVAAADGFSSEMWHSLDTLMNSDRALASFRFGVETAVEGIELVCRDQGTSPSLMPVRSRNSYAWMKFLTTGNHLLQHLEALRIGRYMSLEHGLSTEIHLVNSRTIWSISELSGTRILKVHEGFLHANQPVWSALIPSGGTGPDKSDNVLQQFVASDRFRTVVRELDTFVGPAEDETRGMTHDLDASFRRVNERYFSGAMPKPKLRWNKLLTMRKFGEYQPHRDVVVISVTLDDPAVPDFVLDSVMYHELLHKKHGLVAHNGRHLSHTAAFRKDEARFERFGEAEQHLRQLARKHRF